MLGNFSVGIDALAELCGCTWHSTFATALLAGAAAVPTDAAAVATLLRRSGAALPEKLFALLGVESGLNDPTSVFLTFLLLRVIAAPGSIGAGGAVLLFLKEMMGGAALGVAGGCVLAEALKRLPIEVSFASILVPTDGLALFSLAQLIGTSGFLVTYLAAVNIGATQHRVQPGVEHFFDGMAWLAQIVLFFMLGRRPGARDEPRWLRRMFASVLLP